MFFFCSEKHWKKLTYILQQLLCKASGQNPEINIL
jgi:hypothetical protein